jgi:transcriptional regulator of met regulon
MAARLQLTEQGLQEKVRKNISQFSQNVRLRLEMETNFKQGFDSLFDGFIGKPLPNPDILKKIQEEEDPEVLKKKEKEAND